jgi:hypothetical protein
MVRVVSIALLLAGIAVGQGTRPGSNASAYEVQGALGDLTIGAEYLVHSVPGSSGYLIAENYLVVEAAFFGPRLRTIKLSQSDFELRVADKKTGALRTIGAQSPAFAPSFTAPQRAPGDPGQRAPLPRPPTRVPTSVNNSGIDRDTTLPAGRQIEQASLPVGEQELPVSGVLFFPFKGKTTSIKSLELIYTSPTGKLTLKFF